jgi:PhnB protein
MRRMRWRRDPRGVNNSRLRFHGPSRYSVPMTPKVKAIPDGYHSVTPYLAVRNAAKAIEFYKQAFGAQQRGVLPMPGGKIGHAEIMIGNSIVMLADEFPEHGNHSPESLNGSPVGLAIYVENVDEAFNRAVKKNRSRINSGATARGR